MDALEPRHPGEAAADEHDDPLGPSLALRAEPAGVVDAGAAQQRPLERPAVLDAAHVARELAAVERVGGDHRAAMVPEARALV